MKAPFKLAFYQGGDPNNAMMNLATLTTSLESAASQGVDLVVFPELFVCGYCIGDYFQHAAEHAQGPSFTAVSEACKRFNVGAVYGYAEYEGDAKPGARRVFNSVQMVGRNGEALANYRKTHLWQKYEKAHFVPGDSLPPVVDFDGTCIGLLICYDVEFPEPCRVLAVNGAELVIVPTATTSTFTSEVTVRQRAQENSCFVAYINRVGPEGDCVFTGRSVIGAPDGSNVVSASDCAVEWRVVSLDPTLPAYKQALWNNPYLADRRPALYRDISFDAPLPM